MSLVLSAAGVVLAVAITAGFFRSLAGSGVRPKLLAWAELYLMQAAAVLPDEVAQDLLSEWQADVRTKFQERGALSAVLWARGIALEAAPAIRQRPDERGRHAGTRTFALRLVRAGHAPLALAALFLILRTRLALLLSNNPFAVDTVAVSIALALWTLAEIGGTAFALLFVPRITVVRPVWLMLRSSRSLLGAGVITVFLGIGACGLIEQMINHASTQSTTYAPLPGWAILKGDTPDTPTGEGATPTTGVAEATDTTAPVDGATAATTTATGSATTAAPASAAPPTSVSPSPMTGNPVAAPSPAVVWSWVSSIVLFEGSWLDFGLGSSLFLTLVAAVAFGRLAPQRLTPAHGS